jgi:hypothetical protein
MLQMFRASVCSIKGKLFPLRSIQAHLGDRRYSSCSFLTSALEGGEWSASRPGLPLPPGKELCVCCVYRYKSPDFCLRSDVYQFVGEL